MNSEIPTSFEERQSMPFQAGSQRIVWIGRDLIRITWLSRSRS
jgi:hypothetical protein